MARDEVTASLVRKLWDTIKPERRRALELTEEEEARLARLLPTEAEAEAFIQSLEDVPPEDGPWVDEPIDQALHEAISEHGG